MVFLIQNTQNRDILAVQLKLSELVLAMKGAENRFAAIEDLTDEELEELHEECRARVDDHSPSYGAAPRQAAECRAPWRNATTVPSRTQRPAGDKRAWEHCSNAG